MATKLRSFKFTGAGAGRNRYDWELWLDGSPWQLKAGEDFFSKPVSFRQYVYNAARLRGKSVHIADVGDNTFVIQARPKED